MAAAFGRLRTPTEVRHFTSRCTSQQRLPLASSLPSHSGTVRLVISDRINRSLRASMPSERGVIDPRDSGSQGFELPSGHVKTSALAADPRYSNASSLRILRKTQAGSRYCRRIVERPDHSLGTAFLLTAYDPSKQSSNAFPPKNGCQILF
jgi:hypothetical protein